MRLTDIDRQDVIIYIKGNEITFVKNRFGPEITHKNVRITIDVSGPADPMIEIEDGLWERIRKFFDIYLPDRTNVAE